MSRFMALALCFVVLPTAAHAASLGFRTEQDAGESGQESSVGTPRAINEDILDQGYRRRQPVDQSPQRTRQPRRAHALQPGQRAQLGDSVCSNTGYRQLLARGASSPTASPSTRPTSRSPPRFDAGSCRIQGKKARRAVMLDKQHLLKIARTPMPFGKYQDGCWSTCRRSTCCGSTRGFPPGELRAADAVDPGAEDRRAGRAAQAASSPLRRRMTSPTLSADTRPHPAFARHPPRSAGRITPQTLSADTQPNSAQQRRIALAGHRRRFLRGQQRGARSIKRAQAASTLPQQARLANCMPASSRCRRGCDSRVPRCAGHPAGLAKDDRAPLPRAYG